MPVAAFDPKRTFGFIVRTTSPEQRLLIAMILVIRPAHGGREVAIPTSNRLRASPRTTVTSYRLLSLSTGRHGRRHRRHSLNCDLALEPSKPAFSLAPPRLRPIRKVIPMNSTNSNERQSNVQPGQSAQTGSKDASHKDAKPSTPESGDTVNPEKSAPAQSDAAGTSRR